VKVGDHRIKQHQRDVALQCGTLSVPCRLAEFSSWSPGNRRNNVISDMWKLTKDCMVNKKLQCGPQVVRHLPLISASNI